jgi:hypothetical protein
MLGVPAAILGVVGDGGGKGDGISHYPPDCSLFCVWGIHRDPSQGSAPA